MGRTRTNLSMKIVSVALLPLLLLFVLSAWEVRSSVAEWQRTSALRARIEIVHRISGAIEQAQRERALAARFLEEQATLAALHDAWEATDRAASNLPMTDAFRPLASVRARVAAAEASPAELFREYEAAIRSLVELESVQSERLGSYTALEGAREQLARLAAEDKRAGGTLAAAAENLKTTLNRELGALSDELDAQQAALASRLRWLCLSLLAMLGASVAVLMRQTRAIARPVQHAIRKLSKMAAEVSESSRRLKADSGEIAEVCNQASASLQQTVSALEEINLMISQSSDNAQAAHELSVRGKGSAERGHAKVTEMTRAIHDITLNNDQILQQIERSNREIFEIVTVIANIGEQTKVIHDIVFQTKLLSFNASVEAARAGEHGKGFAVVAEEVGSLAQMSGKAAQEIKAALDASLEKVQGIVEATNSRVQSFVRDGRQKIDIGEKVSRECGEVLSEIVTNVNQVNEMTLHISQACAEQATGVREIAKAMNQMEQATHKNAASSQVNLKTAHQLHRESARLHTIVYDLVGVVSGARAKSDEQAEIPPPPHRKAA